MSAIVAYLAVITLITMITVVFLILLLLLSLLVPEVWSPSFFKLRSQGIEEESMMFAALVQPGEQNLL